MLGLEISRLLAGSPCTSSRWRSSGPTRSGTGSRTTGSSRKESSHGSLSMRRLREPKGPYCKLAINNDKKSR